MAVLPSSDMRLSAGVALAIPLLWAAQACGRGERALGGMEVGTPAPAFAALDLQGDTVSLQSLQGSPVLLNLWATWCTPCRAETPYLQSLHNRLEARGLQVVGISLDYEGALPDVHDFVTEFGVTYRILQDPSQRALIVFAPVGLPATYLIGADGIVRWIHLGAVPIDDPGLQRALDDALTAGVS